MAIKKGLNWTVISLLTLGFILLVAVISRSDEPALVQHKNSDPLVFPKRADHDSNESTIRTFTASNEALISKTNDALIELEQAKKALSQESSTLAREARKYQKTLTDNKQQARHIETLKQQIKQIKRAQAQPAEDLKDFGIGLAPATSTKNLPESSGTWISSDQLLVDEPGQAKKATKKEITRPSRPKNKTAEQSQPLYTIPYDAILSDAKALTALIGRIPIAGKTQDPFPAKIMIGRENLLASGFAIPEIHAMIVSGEALGDWNLSCVRVMIQAVTFIHQDGAITTHHSEGGKKSMGYISDRQGVPCISGQFVSNAAKYIGTRVGLSALGAAGEAYAEDSQTKILSSMTGNITSFTDKIEHLVAGEAVSSATDEIIQWIKERQQNSFDAVVVPPGALVSVHIEQEIPIDTSPQHRSVRYAQHTLPQPYLLD